jgi:uncharacterized protein YbgA (DUF1722 family)/uncharacterized protein YbbK (DUF523 family)
MREGEPEKIRLGISACLLGEKVRYDGGHKRDRFVTDVLSAYVEWVPVCPEVELGLGTPRDPLRLVGRPESPRLVQERTGEDLTDRMRHYAAERVRDFEQLDGYILKRASPSCGLLRVRVYGDNGIPTASGRGSFASVLTTALPTLPVEEEGRLSDPVIRDNFIERVFATARWRAFRASAPRTRDLVAFHAAQKFAVLAHSPVHYTRLGRLVAGGGALDEYGRLLMAGLAVNATRGRHANVLQHLAGYFKRDLDADERAELVEAVTDYRRGIVPLVVPLTLIAHHVRRLGVRYLGGQVYLSPHPKELMLRNHV